MFVAIPLSWLRSAGLLLLGGSLPALVLCLVSAHRSSLARHIHDYEHELARDLAFLRIAVPARRILTLQACAMLCALFLASFGGFFMSSVLLVAALSVKTVIRARRARRTSELDLLLDGWLRSLASTLRATPALGEAIEHSIALVASPLREELDHLVKELKLGVGLDEAVARMGARVQSRTLESALGTLRIGRSTGGDISQVLERAASTLREMARLEGVLRTKTAEGKAQTFVLAVMPFPLLGLLHFLNPSFLAPLFVAVTGHVVLVAALFLWLSSILLARRILRVDL